MRTSCAVTGEYSPDLPSIVGSYRISEYGADYIAAVRANRPYVEHDTTREALPVQERQAFAALRIGSFISAPLFKGGRLVAMFVVHGQQPRRWQEQEIQDVSLVASRCWESIERARVARALAASEDRLALSVESAELGTFYCPMPLGTIVWNKKCKEHFWLPHDAEINFDLFYSILHDEDRQRTAQPWNAPFFIASHMTLSTAPSHPTAVFAGFVPRDGHFMIPQANPLDSTASRWTSPS